MRNRRVRARVPLPEDDAVEEKPKVAEEEEVEDGFEAEPDEAKELDAAIDDAPLIADDDDDTVDPDAAPAAPGDGLGVDFAEDEDLEAADDDEVPFIEDEEDDAFPDDEIEGLGPEGAEDH